MWGIVWLDLPIIIDFPSQVLPECHYFNLNDHSSDSLKCHTEITVASHKVNCKTKAYPEVIVIAVLKLQTLDLLVKTWYLHFTVIKRMFIWWLLNGCGAHFHDIWQYKHAFVKQNGNWKTIHWKWMDGNTNTISFFIYFIATYFGFFFFFNSVHPHFMYIYFCQSKCVFNWVGQ